MLLECNTIRLLVVDADHLAQPEGAQLSQLSRRFAQTAVFMGADLQELKAQGIQGPAIFPRRKGTPADMAPCISFAE